MKKMWMVLAAVFFAALIGSSAHRAIKSWSDDRVDAARPSISMVVNDSTKAELAHLRFQKDSLTGLLDASRTMKGKPVAGFEIVTKPETVFVAMKAASTHTLTDSTGLSGYTLTDTRVAMLTDTTKQGYVIRMEGKAPPTGPLWLGYRLDIPSFNPEVGFVKRPEGYFAVVSWAGQDFTIKNAFFTPEKERPLTLYVGADLSVSPAANVVGAKPSGAVYGLISYSLSQKLSVNLRVGHDGAPFIGLGALKRVW